jgi:hypothetical protein
MTNPPSPRSGSVAAEIKSLQADPIPLFEAATLKAGVRFLLLQLPLLAPVYAALCMEQLTGRAFGAGLPDALTTVVALLAIPYCFWAFGATDRRRRGEPMFGETDPLTIARIGFSVWWRAIFVVVRLVLLLVILTVVLRVVGMRSRTVSDVINVASVLALVPTWGFAVRFWDRTLARGEAVTRPAALSPRWRQLEWTAVALVWLTVGAAGWRARSAYAENADPCQHTRMTLVRANGETRLKSWLGSYEAYVSVRDGQQALHIVNGATGGDIEVDVPHNVRFVSLGFERTFGQLLFAYDDSTGQRMIEEARVPEGDRINYTRDNRHIAIALSADGKRLTRERGMPGSCAELTTRR